jgi:adenylate cyclase
MNTTSSAGAGPTLDARIVGSFGHRYWQELFRNTGQFPIANLLLELLTEGPEIFLAPDIYVLVAAALTQTWVIARSAHSRRPRPFIGNLVGPAVYTAVEALIEGTPFFGAPNHIAYWCFALAIGALQWGRQHAPRAKAGRVLVVAESVVRASILFAMYTIFEAVSEKAPFSLAAFFADPAHVFIGLATLILGLSAGLESISAQGYLELLRETSSQLKRYSEWLLGADLLERVIADPAALTLARRERTVVFMDIRGFTAWSERCPPETVVQALNEYYAAAEPVLRGHGVIKLKFSADEVLAVFAEPRQAAACALALRERASAALSRWGLGAGIGMHLGPVVEGLLGSEGVKGYDVIGDTVNTAKRIEGAAAGGEVLVSDALLAALERGAATGPRREVVAKGKEIPIAVYPLL